jgi:hypothetical protein
MQTTVLNQKNTKAITFLRFDLPNQPDTAAKTADEMVDLPTTANSDKADANYSKTIRDKAYTHLKVLVDEIREAEVSFSFPKLNHQLFYFIRTKN